MPPVLSKIQERQYIFITVLLASVSGPIMLSGVTVALPTIGNELSMNAVELGWVNYAFNLALVVCTIPLGRLADITGRKRIYTIGIILFEVSTILSTLSNSSLMFILLRVAQGASLADLTP